MLKKAEGKIEETLLFGYSPSEAKLTFNHSEKTQSIFCIFSKGALREKTCYTSSSNSSRGSISNSSSSIKNDNNDDDDDNNITTIPHYATTTTEQTKITLQDLINKA